MNQTIRMGVIGLGGISVNHIRGIQSSADACLAAICDIDGQKLESRGEALGIPRERRYVDWRVMLHEAGLDGVSICTPNQLHVEMGRACVALGLPFAIEKPVGMNVDEVTTLEREARETGAKHMVCLSYRFKAAARMARHLVRAGYLGELHHIYAQYEQSTSIDPLKPLLWRFQSAMGGGTNWDLNCHMMDLASFITGCRYRSLCAQTGILIDERRDPETGDPRKVDVDDYCHILCELENRATAAFLITKFAYGRGNHQRIEILGSKGSLIYTLEDEDQLYISIDGVEARTDGPGFLTTQPGDWSGIFTRRKDHEPLVIPDEFRADQMQSFFDILLDRGDGNAATLADGLCAQILLEKVADSARNRTWVDV